MIEAEDCCGNCAFWLRNTRVVKTWRTLFGVRLRFLPPLEVVEEPSDWGVCRFLPRTWDATARGFAYPDQNEDDWCGQHDVGVDGGDDPERAGLGEAFPDRVVALADRRRATG